MQLERFWAKVRRTDTCWLWVARRNERGYGEFRSPMGRTTLAHRYAYEETFGAFDKHLCVCHKCDNPACVRPDHLFLGTRADNNGDRQVKGRSNPSRGARTRSAKLTPTLVNEIRALGCQGASKRALARRFGVGSTTIQNVLSGHTWRLSHPTVTAALRLSGAMLALYAESPDNFDAVVELAVRMTKRAAETPQK